MTGSVAAQMSQSPVYFRKSPNYGGIATYSISIDMAVSRLVGFPDRGKLSGIRNAPAAIGELIGTN